jgi:hypothetical protein
MELLKSHIWLTASLYMITCLRKPFLIYDFATTPFRISLYMRKIFFSFLSVHTYWSYRTWCSAKPMEELYSILPADSGSNPAKTTLHWSPSSMTQPLDSIWSVYFCDHYTNNFTSWKILNMKGQCQRFWLQFLPWIILSHASIVPLSPFQFFLLEKCAKIFTTSVEFSTVVNGTANHIFPEIAVTSAVNFTTCHWHQRASMTTIFDCLHLKLEIK